MEVRWHLQSRKKFKKYFKIHFFSRKKNDKYIFSWKFTILGYSKCYVKAWCKITGETDESWQAKKNTQNCVTFLLGGQFQDQGGQFQDFGDFWTRNGGFSSKFGLNSIDFTKILKNPSSSDISNFFSTKYFFLKIKMCF